MATAAELARRKENFIKYYSTPEGKKKLKGKSVHDAFAAMRREAGRQNSTSRKTDGYDSAIRRRLDKGSNKAPKAWQPLRVSDATRPIGKALGKLERATDPDDFDPKKALTKAWQSTPAYKRAQRTGEPAALTKAVKAVKGVGRAAKRVENATDPKVNVAAVARRIENVTDPKIGSNKTWIKEQWENRPYAQRQRAKEEAARRRLSNRQS